MALTVPSIPTEPFRSYCSNRAKLQIMELTQALSRATSPWQMPHRRQYYQVLWLRVGLAQVHLDGEPLLLTPGQLLFVTPHQILSLQAEEPVEGYVISFQEVFLLETVQDAHLLYSFRLFTTGITVVSPSAGEEAFLSQVLATLYGECQGYRPFGSEQIMRQALKIFLTKCEQLRRQTGQVAHGVPALQPLAAAFQSLLEQHYRQEATVAFYARQLGVKSDQLTEATKQYYGMAASHLIEKRRLLEAKRLLYYSSQSVKEIAFHLHFTDASHFIKFFRRQAGLTPLAYRRGLASPA